MSTPPFVASSCLDGRTTAAARLANAILLAAILAPARPAAAASIYDLQVVLASDIGGVQLGESASTDLGGGWVNYVGSLVGSDLDGDDLPDYLFEWDVDANADPIVAGVMAVTNNTAAFQNFSMLFLQPAAPPLGAPTKALGSIGITVSDGNASMGAVVRHFDNDPGIPVYEGQIDGILFQTLIAPYPASPPFPLVAPTIGSNTINNAFGPLAGPAVNNDIAVLVRFQLSPGDSVAVTVNFTVIPEPSTLALAGVAIAVLAAGCCAGRSRRRLG